MRYIVLEVGCLECSGGEGCLPEVLLRTDDRDEAIARATKAEHASDLDRFVVDVVEGSLLTPNRAG